ncbi:hypothetical protein STAL104432_29375 [Streptomyces albus]
MCPPVGAGTAVCSGPGWRKSASRQRPAQLARSPRSARSPMPQERLDSRPGRCTSRPGPRLRPVRVRGAGTAPGATTSVLRTGLSPGACAQRVCTPGGSSAPDCRPRTSPLSVTTRSAVPSGSPDFSHTSDSPVDRDGPGEPDNPGNPGSCPSGPGRAPERSTTVGGSSRRLSSACRSSAARTAAGVEASTPSAASTATTVSRPARTRRPGEGRWESETPWAAASRASGVIRSPRAPCRSRPRWVRWSVGPRRAGVRWSAVRRRPTAAHW